MGSNRYKLVFLSLHDFKNKLYRRKQQDPPLKIDLVFAQISMLIPKHEDEGICTVRTL